MRSRTLLIALLIAAGFVYWTSTNPSLFRHGDDPPGTRGPLWSGPDVAFSAGLSPAEENNIEIYKLAHTATVNITSTVYRRGWFQQIYPSRDSGSGVIVNAEGQILTNNHVISGRAPKIQVTLADHSQHDATVLTKDSVNDLALIKIDVGKPLPYLRLGDSDGIQVGQKVLAIGNPFGLEGTLTTGIISSLGRTIEDEKGNQLEDMIQTDAAINPGNSGGPLLDSQGDVIAINTAIYGPGGNIGIGFAMPINLAKRMLDDYRAGRKFGQPVLGVTGTPIRGKLAVTLGLPAEGGFLVYQVYRDTPAQQSGIRGASRWEIVGNYEIGVGGDLILSIDGRPMNQRESLTRFMRRKRPGDVVELKIFRDGHTQTLKITLGSRKDGQL